MTLNDLECPIHLKVRFTDGRRHAWLRTLWLSDSTIRIGVARGDGRGVGWRPPSMWAGDALFLCGSWASCSSLCEDHRCPCREICTFEPYWLSLAGSIGYLSGLESNTRLHYRPTDIQNVNYIPMDPPNYPTYGTSVPTSSLYLRSSDHVYFTSFTNDERCWGQDCFSAVGRSATPLQQFGTHYTCWPHDNNILSGNGHLLLLPDNCHYDSSFSGVGGGKRILVNFYSL